MDNNRQMTYFILLENTFKIDVTLSKLKRVDYQLHTIYELY